MATVVTHSARWSPALVPATAAEAAPDPAAHASLRPRKAWPLLATVIATWLLMLATIAWYATGA